MKKILKIVSFIIIFSMLSFYAVVPIYAQGKTTMDYYVKNGGIGNGKSVDAPAPDVNTVIAQINADGLVAGDIANVFIMQDATCNTAGNPHGMAYLGSDGFLTAHTATLAIQGYGNTEKYLTFTNTLYTTQGVTLGGATTFKNIKLVAPNKDSNLNLNAGDVQFLEGSSYGYATGNTPPISVSEYVGNRLTVAIASRQSGGITYADDAKVVFNNGFNDNLVIGTCMPSRTINYQKNVDIVFDNAGTDAKVTWGSSNTGSNVNVTGDINLNVKSATAVENVAGTSNLNVYGGVQIINSGSGFTGDVANLSNITIAKGFWQINNVSGNKDIISFTETRGIFDVNGSQRVVATNVEDGEERYSENGKLILPVGTYTLDVVKVPVEQNYYVKNGENGDGTTPESPLATVADAVNKANSDGLRDIDIAHIYVLQRDDWATISGTTHNMTIMGGDMPSHTPKVVIESYGDTPVNLCSANNISQTNFMLTGKVEFRNINLVLAQNNAFVYCGGGSVSFDENTAVKYASNNNGTVKVANAGSSSNLSISAFGNNLTFADEANFVIESPITVPVTLSALIVSRNQTYNKNVNVVIDNENYNNTVNWASCTTNVKGNFNVNIKNATSVTNNAGSGSLKITGALQVMADMSKVTGDPTTFANVTATGGKWLIDNRSGISDIVEFTSTSGVYKVKKGYDVILKNNNNVEYTPSNGKVTIPAGSYTLTATKTPIIENYYVINGGIGDGSSPESPLATIAEAVNKANADGLTDTDIANIFVMQRDDWATISSGTHNMTIMGADTMPVHDAKVIIQSYGDTPVNLSDHATLTQSTFQFTGNIEFKNIILVLSTNNSKFYCGGGSVKFGEGVSLKYAKNDGSIVTPSLAGSNSDISISAFANNLTFADDANIVIESALTVPVTLSALISSRNQVYNKDVNVVFNNENYNNSINWAACTTRVKGNFNVNIKNAASVTNNAGTGTLNIDGALQVVVGQNVDFSGNPLEFSNVSAQGGKWLLFDNSGIDNAVALTNTPGVFNVANGVIAVDESDNEIEPVNGVLTLPAGEYTLIDESSISKQPTMLYLREEKISGNEVFVQKTKTLKANTEYLFSFDYKFLSGELEKTLNASVYAGPGTGDSIYKNYLVGPNAALDFTSVTDNGKTAEYRFTLTEEAIGTNTDFYVGFTFTTYPQIITEAYFANISLYEANDTDKVNQFKSGICETKVTNWKSHYGGSLAGNEIFARDGLIEYTAKYLPKVEEYFADDTTPIIHYGDANDDGKIDIIDLVALKKHIANKSDYKPELDIDKNNLIDANDIIRLVNHIIGKELIVWSDLSLPAVTMKTGGADEQAANLRQSILSATGTVTAGSGKTTYYVSENGKDTNSGRFNNSPIKTISKVNSLSLNEGDVVLFERGSVFRTDVPLEAVYGVSYGVYGTGDKPQILGSMINYADNTLWTEQTANIWKATMPSNTVGNIILNDGEYFGEYKSSLEELHNNGQYYFDSSNRILYFYFSLSNPGDYFASIEIPTTESLISQKANSLTDTTFKNLSVKYAAVMGFDLKVCTNVKIQNCEVAWIGGAKMVNSEKRYGNGIQFWAKADNCEVTDNYIYQVYDSAVTFQGTAQNIYKDLDIKNNLIEYCSMNFEFWASEPGNSDATSSDLDAEMTNIAFQNNILRFGGFGFGGRQRYDINDQAFVLGWNNVYKANQITNFTIKNNIFDTADSYFFYGTKALENIDVSENTYYQKAGSIMPIVKGYASYSNNQSDFETAISTVDSNPTGVYFIGSDVVNDGNFTVESIDTSADNNGLVFAINAKKSLLNAMPTVLEIGTIYADADETCCANLYLDKKVVYSWNKTTLEPIESDVTPTKVIANNFIVDNATDKKYTLCISGLTSDDYCKFFSARGYIKYLDKDGVQQVLYTEQVQGSLYKAAAEKPVAERTSFDIGIINYVTGGDMVTDYNTAYAKQSYDDSYTLSDGTFQYSNQNCEIYRQNDMWVRDVTVDTGIQDFEKTEIAFVVDSHLNFINEDDIMDGVDNTLNTYKSRTMAEGQSGYNKISNVLEYANMFDKVVVGGDVFDYFSKGNLELTNRLFTERSVDGKISTTLGNHEYMETMNGATPNYDMDYKYEQIQSVWTNDIYYASEIMKDANGNNKLMLIYLDNGDHHYWDCQVEPLTNDLAYAKANNIPVIIFQHIPMLTMNENETEYPIIDAAGDWHGLWDMATHFGSEENHTAYRDMTSSTTGYIGIEYDNQGKELDNATNAVIKLIRSNYSTVKAVFTGHEHANMYTEIVGIDENGDAVQNAYIPQHTAYCAYNNGVMKITVQ